MTLQVIRVAVGASARGAFTGRDLLDDDASSPAVGLAGNVSPSQPHVPARLAADRDAAAATLGANADTVVWMHQVHGAEVGVVDGDTPAGALVRDVDALVTTDASRVLGVQVADCVPVLLAAGAAVGVAHAGRRGVVADVVGAAVSALRELDEQRGLAHQPVHAVVGPSIRGCCYEVEDWLRDDVAADHPDAAATTSWGTSSLDLPAAVTARLRAMDVEVDDVGACTHCDDRWFSHRSTDRGRGRQAGLVRPARGPAAGGEETEDAAARPDAQREAA